MITSGDADSEGKEEDPDPRSCSPGCQSPPKAAGKPHISPTGWKGLTRGCLTFLQLLLTLTWSLLPPRMFLRSISG